MGPDLDMYNWCLAKNSIDDVYTVDIIQVYPLIIHGKFEHLIKRLAHSL